ncbi:hypothetical protein JZ751_020076 [Albula glossodonta]|uniref:Uncharacterized protein n=1 Tax=Albula glossodonta TaxID=121402 RepID=A0A8T2NJK0_9TELE|nr:hypothetical protein JZ751_020076 [Albula glossodonta]
MVILELNLKPARIAKRRAKHKAMASPAEPDWETQRGSYRKLAWDSLAEKFGIGGIGELRLPHIRGPAFSSLRAGVIARVWWAPPANLHCQNSRIDLVLFQQAPLQAL